MTLGENIKLYRNKAKLTQKELGEKIGISQQQIAQYENGKRLPKIETINKIANALQCSVYELRGMPEDLEWSVASRIAEYEDLRQKAYDSLYNGDAELASRTAKHENSHQKTYDLSHNDDTNNKNTETETLLTNIQSLFDKLNANGKSEAIKRLEELTHLKQYTDK